MNYLMNLKLFPPQTMKNMKKYNRNETYLPHGDLEVNLNTEKILNLQHFILLMSVGQRSHSCKHWAVILGPFGAQMDTLHRIYRTYATLSSPFVCDRQTGRTSGTIVVESQNFTILDKVN